MRCFLNIYPDWFLSLPCVFDWPPVLSLDSALKICPSLAASVVSNSMKRRESSTHISKDWHMCHVRTTPVSLFLLPPPFLQLFWISPPPHLTHPLYSQSIGAKPEITLYFSTCCISHLLGWVWGVEVHLWHLCVASHKIKWNKKTRPTFLFHLQAQLVEHRMKWMKLALHKNSKHLHSLVRNPNCVNSMQIYLNHLLSGWAGGWKECR